MANEYRNRRRLLNTFIILCGTISIFLDDWDSPWFYVFKPLTTILVILLAVLAKGMNLPFKRMLVIALCFCLLGDVLLMDANYFVYGLTAFLIAHLLFAKGFIGLEGFQKKPIVGVILTTIGIGLYVWLYPDLGALEYPVAGYVLVILFMAWQGIGLYVSDRTKAYGFIALGAILFMFSDSMIAVNKFIAPFEGSGAIILSTYWLAIALIANAVYFVTGKPDPMGN